MNEAYTGLAMTSAISATAMIIVTIVWIITIIVVAMDIVSVSRAILFFCEFSSRTMFHWENFDHVYRIELDINQTLDEINTITTNINF